MSINETLAEREKTYGNFYQESALVENILKALRATDRWDYLDPDMKLAIQMNVLKLVRIVQGNAYHIDNWHDIQGYAKLVEDRLLQAKSREVVKQFKENWNKAISGNRPSTEDIVKHWEDTQKKREE